MVIRFRERVAPGTMNSSSFLFTLVNILVKLLIMFSRQCFSCWPTTSTPVLFSVT